MASPTTAIPIQLRSLWAVVAAMWAQLRAAPLLAGFIPVDEMEEPRATKGRGLPLR